MTSVLDRSVLLAGVLGEAGGGVLDAPGALFHVSAVNLSEVYTRIVERGGCAGDVDLPILTADAKWADLGTDIRPIR